MRRRLLVSSLVVLIAVLAAVTLTLPGLSQASPHARTPKEDSKVSSVLRDVLDEMQGYGVTRSNAGAMQVWSMSVEDVLRVASDGRIQVYIHVPDPGPSQLEMLEELEVGVELVNDDLGLVQDWVPFDRIEDVAELEFVNRVQTPDYARRRAGSLNSEGDSILRADLVRSQLGFTGDGIKIGVISDGVDSISAPQASGDLPAGIEVDPSLSGSGDEGTAMLEIVHDLAPDAGLAFSGPGTSLEMIDSVDFLAVTAFGGLGADIIVDDLGFYLEPYIEDGAVADAVAGALSGGAVYVSAAGNDAESHFEGDYAAGADGFHDFGGGDVTMSATLSGGGVMSAYLQWNDPLWRLRQRL